VRYARVCDLEDINAAHSASNAGLDAAHYRWSKFFV